MLDVANPWPGIGWENRERPSFFERVQSADLVLALALVHHLVISNNLPLTAIAEAFASIGKTLVIEWVPKDDSQVQRMLSTRRDVFESYNEDEFRRAFGQWFHIRDVVPIVESKRKLYVLETRGPQ